MGGPATVADQPEVHSDSFDPIRAAARPTPAYFFSNRCRSSASLIEVAKSQSALALPVNGSRQDELIGPSTEQI
jgi:hypothetical protein